MKKYNLHVLIKYFVTFIMLEKNWKLCERINTTPLELYEFWMDDK